MARTGVPPRAAPALGTRWWSRSCTIALLITGASAGLRLLVALHVPLFPDETYYWEWSRRLAAGYFDHPPAIAWLIRGGTALLGSTGLGVRAGALASGIVTALATIALAERLAPAAAAPRSAVWAAALLAGAPLAALGLALATTDAPVLAAVAVLLYAVCRAVEPGASARATLAWWLAAGAALGLGLASKYTTGLFALAILAALLARPALRRQLARAAPWLGALVALAILAPVLAWNARHGWVSFRFQAAHGLGATGGSALGRELSFFGGQAALVSPALFVLLLATLAVELRGTPERASPHPVGGERDDRRFLLAFTGATVLGFFALAATRRPAEPNWPAPAYLPALALLASAPPASRRARWRGAALALGAAMVALGAALAVAPVAPIAGPRDPIARAHGWQALAAHAERTRAAVARRTGGPTWLAADRYQDASELAFHTPAHPVVFALNLGGRANQYDLWPGFAACARVGDDLVVVLDDGADVPAVVRTLVPHFTGVTEGEVVVLARGEHAVARRRLWTLEGWRGTWPPAPRDHRAWGTRPTGACADSPAG